MLVEHYGPDYRHIGAVIPPHDLAAYASELIKNDPGLLPDIILWRWEIELRRGIVKFDPRNPSCFQEIAIGQYLKRIIPDRIQTKGEQMSGATTPVYEPFEQMHSGFNYFMIPPEQKLFEVMLGNKNYNILASNSPLTYNPHTLLVSQEKRSQFLSPEDFECVSLLCLDYPNFTFTYSSLGAGAGVNHQHWHMIAGQESYPILCEPLKEFYTDSTITLGMPKHWITNSIVIGGDHEARFDLAARFTKFLQDRNIPHNLFIQQNQIWINPRSRKHSAAMPSKKFGTWETILGICNTSSWDEYHQVDEALFEKALLELKLDVNDEKELKTKLISMI